MKPGATTLREASIRLPPNRLNWFFGAIRAIQPFSIRTEWLGNTAGVFPAVSTVPFSMSSDMARYIVTKLQGLVLQGGQFTGAARAHGDGASKTLLRAQRTPDAERAEVFCRSEEHTSEL